MAAASQALKEGGYRQIDRSFDGWDSPTSRLFEDEYNIVGVAVFDTSSDLLQAWPDVQGSLVNVISKHVGRQESKSWDGYLVLLTPAIAPSEHAAVESVRYDTTRLRKFVATGSDLRNLQDVQRVISPLLPLGQERISPSRQSALDLLPALLAYADSEISEPTTKLIIQAFQEQSSMLERLHQREGKR